MAGTSITLEDFMGLMPKRDKRLLPTMASQFAQNAKLWSGAIDPIRAPLTVFNTAKSGTNQSMYRMDDRDGGSDFWLHWPFDVDAIRGAVADARQRLYYTGEYEPRVTTFEMAALGTDTIDGTDNYPSGYGTSGNEYPLAFYALGCHAPPCEGLISVSGGVDADIERAYVFTNVSAWGEESGPSPVIYATDAPDGDWTVNFEDNAPPNTVDVMHAIHASGTVTVWTDEFHYLRAGHRVTIASVTGMTEINGDWTLKTARSHKTRITDRERTSNVAKLYLERLGDLKVNDRISVATVGGVGYDGSNLVITAVNIEEKSIEYTDTAADEAKTADTDGIVDFGDFTFDLASATAYTSGGTVDREAPYNVTGMTRRLYRTATGNVDTDFQLVAEMPIADTSFVDDLTDDQLGPVWESTEGVDIPPGTGFAITEMANGMAALATDEEVRFCDPYKYHAWRDEFTQVCNWPVIGLKGLGQRLVVPTKGMPYTMDGIEPASVVADFIELNEPCVSKRSIHKLGEVGVLYASDRGLVVVNQVGASLVSHEYFSRDEWRDFANAGVWESSMVYDGRYYSFWTNSQGGGESFVFNPTEPNAMMTQNTELVTGAWQDPETGNAYVIYDDDGSASIGQWDSDPAIRRTYQWRSKEYKIPKPVNYGAARLNAEFTLTEEESLAIDAENATREAANDALLAMVPSGTGKRAFLRGAMGSSEIGVTSGSTVRTRIAMADTILQPLLNAQGQFVQIEFICNGETVHVESLLSERTFSLPKGEKHDEWEFQITGNVRTQSVRIAETRRGLRHR